MGDILTRLKETVKKDEKISQSLLSNCKATYTYYIILINSIFI